MPVEVGVVALEARDAFLSEVVAEALPTEVLEARITAGAAQLAAATCAWLGLVGEYEHREAWRSWGAKSCADWLSWHCGLDITTGREHVRVARALREYSAITDAFASGRLSYSKVRVITRVVTGCRVERTNRSREGLRTE